MKIKFFGRQVNDYSDGTAGVTLTSGKTTMITVYVEDDDGTRLQASDSTATFAWTLPDWMPVYPEGFPSNADMTQPSPTDDLVGRTGEITFQATTPDGRQESKSLPFTIAGNR
ncbi:MAG: hypothetical protein ACRDRO_23360 [Pseudonocardiaceae bacterium]